jgi:Mg-chelatase subunit ChlD
VNRRAVRSLKGWLCSALLLVGSLSGGGWAQGFTVSPARYLPPSGAACDVVLPQLQTLERLLGMSGTPQLAFTRAIPLRQQEYAALESRLASLSVRSLPYAPAELASLSRPSMPALRQEFTVRYETVPSPDYLAGIFWLTMAVGMGYLTVSAYSEGAELGTVAGGGVLAVASGYLGLLALSLTRRVEHRDPIQAAISANAATRRQHEQEVARVERENAEREARRREQETVEAENRAVQEARRELAAAMNAFEPESRFVAERILPELDAVTRRCLDQLIYGGAIARVGPSSAVLSLAVTPVNRAGAVMYEADPGRAFRFSVRDIGLFGTTGRLGGAADAVVRAVRPFDPGEFDVAPVTAVLVIDSSGSMRDNDPQRLRAQGVMRFLDGAPANAYIGMLQFIDSSVRVLAPISQDFARLRQAASGIGSSGGTPLYAAGLDALAQLAAHGLTTRQVLVMLSDGLDESSPSGSRSELIRRAREQRVPIYAIGLGNVDFRDFQQLAVESGGSFILARTAEDVVTALEQLARLLNAAYVIDVEVPLTTRSAGSDGEVGAVVTAQHEGIGASTTASGYVRLIRLD